MTCFRHELMLGERSGHPMSASTFVALSIMLLIAVAAGMISENWPW